MKKKKKMLPQTKKQLSLDFLLCEVIKCFYCIKNKTNKKNPNIFDLIKSFLLGAKLILIK